MTETRIDWLATNPPRPTPSVLTKEEAAVYLRLPENGNHGETFKQYIRSGRLRGVRVGRQTHYRLKDLEAFLDLQQEFVK